MEIGDDEWDEVDRPAPGFEPAGEPDSLAAVEEVEAHDERAAAVADGEEEGAEEEEKSLHFFVQFLVCLFHDGGGDSDDDGGGSSGGEGFSPLFFFLSLYGELKENRC